MKTPYLRMDLPPEITAEDPAGVRAMLGWLLVLFVTVPVGELALLIWIGQKIEVLPTVALVVGTGILGAALTRYQGLQVLSRCRTALVEGRSPHEDVADGILILMAGAVLITPGIITDAVGLLLLIPSVRRAIRRRATAWIARRVVITDGRRPPRGDGSAPDIVDAEFTVTDESRRDA